MILGFQLFFKKESIQFLLNRLKAVEFIEFLSRRATSPKWCIGLTIAS